MILIADSGSTKTAWSLVEYGEIKKTIETQGLNPYFVTSEVIESVISSGLLPNLVAKFVTEIHFYGAGCSTTNNNRKLLDAFEPCFPEAAIHINHDILGAARALFGGEKGIACILGTGSNACFYNGEQVFTEVPSLGYLYGDEGAGSNLGKMFIEGYLKNKLPADIRKEFEETYPLTLEEILNSLYNKPSPNRFLAAFSEFIAPRQTHPFLHELIRTSFQSFVEEQVKHYKGYENLTVSFVGSVAWHYKEILMEVATANRLHVGQILRSPIEGLVKYHCRRKS